MVFCPEDGDPAFIKPRLYTDLELFAGRAATEDQGYLLVDGQIVDSRGPDPALPLVQQLLDSEAGNPLAAGANSAADGDS